MGTEKVQPAHEVHARLNSQVLLQLQKNKAILAVGFFLSCMWNLAAPIKAWALSRYGFASTSDTLVLELDWNTVVNGRFLTSLYTSAGIPLTSRMEKTRYINVFLDFMVAPRSDLRWVASLLGTNGTFQMDVDGVAKRLSLNGSREVDQFNVDVAPFASTGFPLWGSEVIFDFVPPTTKDVGLHEVSEALLCLKGLAPEDLVNLQFPSNLHPYASASDAAAINMWRAKVFPDLRACMDRRAALLASAKTPADGLLALANELASRYDLGLVNIAGHHQLYTPQTFWDGFVDISGYKSGSVTYQISGRDPSTVLTTGSGHLDAILNPRETAWYCTLQYVNPISRAPNATECFAKFATTLPAFFNGKYLSVLAGTRYNDNNAFEKGTPTQRITPYTYKRPYIAPLNAMTYVNVGNLSAWQALFQTIVANATQTPRTTSNALEEMCLVGDGCFATCMNSSASGGTTVTYMRGGVCQASVDTTAHGLVDLFVDPRCFGSGTSHLQVTYQSLNGVRHTLVINGTAGPVAILACFIGGRPPDTEYPSYVMDMLAQGTQASLVMTKANGSETTVLNFIALLSLAGYMYFFVRIVVYLRKTYTWMRAMPISKRKKAQLLFSVTNSSISNVIWSHYQTSMRCIGFLSFLEWHIGASQNHCHWTDSIQDVSLDAVYVCDVDIFGHFANVQELVRLAAYSWVFFALVFMDRMPGIAIDLKGYGVAALLLGVLPVSLFAILVAEICVLRATVPALSWIHNQLWLALVWLVIMAILRSGVFLPYFKLVKAALRLVGIGQQRISKASPFYSIIFRYYWSSTDLIRDEELIYVPLSILMETHSINVSNVFDHQYFVYGLMDLETDTSDRKLPYVQTDGTIEHPDWIATTDEYYVRIAKRDD
ncbi:hypothetical protein SDRG_12524 [Saprolegnia diclina VS20]|uniref:Uncharacterized protein n=1 Tax=Saprolegnia diclina (strain VS20) TaxID=1156394 RepID=T0RIQ8_SAPDV|nr:hypothetical protein SDRG_12524 [Saprolegnia diclina VS20]EQC29752.1 hypothetical protein SDRG_12524 [Saprolegnia diclina VS20]|eukprot:XP_008616818.1 hypothetical protein SDRG_12524 [Saprolegnia diclina VS20]